MKQDVLTFPLKPPFILLQLIIYVLNIVPLLIRGKKKKGNINDNKELKRKRIKKKHNQASMQK